MPSAAWLCHGVCSPCSSPPSGPTQDSPEPSSTPCWGTWKAQISSLPCGSQRRPGDVRGLAQTFSAKPTTLPFLLSRGPPMLMRDIWGDCFPLQLSGLFWAQDPLFPNLQGDPGLLLSPSSTQIQHGGKGKRDGRKASI